MTADHLAARLLSRVQTRLREHEGREYLALDARHHAILHAVAALLAELQRDVAALKHAATRHDAE